MTCDLADDMRKLLCVALVFATLDCQAGAEPLAEQGSDMPPDVSLQDADVATAVPDLSTSDVGPVVSGDTRSLDADPESDARPGGDVPAENDAGVDAVEVPTAVTLSPTYFYADGAASRGVSAWATARYPDAFPKNARSTVFWGRFRQGGCAAPGYGLTVEHPLSVPGATVFRSLSPTCLGSYGPSVDADVHVNGKPQHLLRSDVRPSGAFQTFGAAGQNATGANQYIQAVYTNFNPSWTMDAANRLRPWGGPSVDPTRVRVAIRARESVTADLLEAPDAQQLQQVIRFLVINEACDPAASSTYCQIEFNFKTYNRGVGAYTSFTTGSVFNDNGQGGLIAVVGPIADTSQSTNVDGKPAWTSWGSSTQLAPFQDKLFQVEISWDQFQDLLTTVSGGNPAPLFGASWQDRQKWVLLRIGYGQENYNRSATASSFVEGMFEFHEVTAL